MPLSSDTANAMVKMVLGDVFQEPYYPTLPTAEEFQQAARWVLWVIEGPDPDSQEPGGFTTDLIRLMFRADLENLRLLAHVYPSLAAIIHTYKTKPDGERIVRALRRLLN